MNLAELFKKNIVMIPVVVSILVGTFTGIKYVINLTDTINSNKDEIIALQEVEITNLKRDLDRRLGICDIHDCTDHQIRST